VQKFLKNFLLENGDLMALHIFFLELVTEVLVQLWLNAIGLFLGMLGVAVIFKWGPPQPSFKTSLVPSDRTVLPDGTTASERARANKRLKSLYQNRSRIGLGLLGAGFLFQFIALWVPA
jgi:hypothetical protein